MKTNKKAYTGKAVFIVDGSRTPFLKSNAKTAAFSASDLAFLASRDLLLKQNISVKDLDEIIFGCVMPGPDEVNIARIIGLRLGCDHRTPAWTVQRNCASGMQAIESAAQSISQGRADMVLAGGTEAMSFAPLLFSHAMSGWLMDWSMARSFSAKLKALRKFRPAMLAPIIGLLRGLRDPVIGLSMGQTAENIAHRFNITREQMDAFSLLSHERLGQAHDDGNFSERITLYDQHGNFFQEDTGLRRGGSLDKLARLKPVFDKPFGLVTAANSAQITDGAAAVILASEAAVKKHQLTPIAKIIDAQWAGVDPAEMGLGPVHAMSPIMKRHKLTIDDIAYWEINEAFAGQVLACMSAWTNKEYCTNELELKNALGEIPSDRLNIYGGGISIGHPVGASGARIVLQLAKTLQRNNKKLGMASLCIGGGQGGAMLLENVGGGSDE